MLRRLLLLSILTLAASPLLAACNLSMTIACDDGSCTATTVNTGGACNGLVYTGWFSQDTSENLRFTNVDTTLPGIDECYDSEDWGELEMAFAFCYGHSSVGNGFTSRVTVSGANAANVPLVAITWVGSADGTEELGSAYAFTNVTAPTCTPIVSAPPVTQSGREYNVTWTAVSDLTAQYVVEESTTPDFSANVTQSQVNGLSKTFRHDGMATTTTYYYRVRPTHCTGGTPGLSQVAQTVVQAVPAPQSKNAETVIPFGSTAPVGIPVFIPGPNPYTPTTFTARTDKPYLTVTPDSGNLPAQGITVTVTAAPGSLPPGASTGTLIVTTNSASNSRVTTNGATTINIPVQVSLVTPVFPGGKSSPPENALMIPGVTHVNGSAGPFLSDVRLTNAGNLPIDYQVTFTPTQTDATTSSKITTVTVDAEQTIALNDIVKNFFGLGLTTNPGDVGFGALEIRPLNTSSPFTYASSRTYASTVNGTFGQYIAAIPFSKFATRRIPSVPIPGAPQTPAASPVLSLQHVAQSAKFRTNVGIVEGAGEPASGRFRIFDAAGTLLKEIPYSLLPGEHRQINGLISNPQYGNIPNLEDGRIEVTVDSPTGAVTATASVLDNRTTDPLAVFPADVANINATRYVVPGMAELGDRVDNFHSDLRIFNGGTTDTPITMTYYPMGNGTPIVAEPRTVRKGEMLVLDNVLPAYFNVQGGGGSIVITTPQNSSLVATGRTYTIIENGGTFGQFIPGVTPAEGTAAGETPLHLLQLEESAGFRTNVAFTELTGNPVTVRVKLHLPDTKQTPMTELTLAPNEYRQLRPLLGLNPGEQTYNARLEVEVIGGSGRVMVSGSVIDNASKDPTYVPAQ
jgi:hypothetical protein